MARGFKWISVWFIPVWNAIGKFALIGNFVGDIRNAEHQKELLKYLIFSGIMPCGTIHFSTTRRIHGKENGVL